MALTPQPAPDDSIRLLLPWLREEVALPSAEQGDPAHWQALLDAAGRHCVAPLLYDRIRAAGALDRLPPETGHALEQSYARGQALDALRWHSLERAITALARAGVDVILLKGAALVAAGIYERPATRPMDDLDILVDPAHCRGAAACLEGLGYTPDHAEQFDGALEQVSHHLALSASHPYKHTLELHHAVLGLPAVLVDAIPVAGLLARAERATVGEAHAWVLHPVDQLITLAAHLVQHGAGAERLIWYVDLDRLIRRAGARLDWDEVLERAVLYRMALPLAQVLERLVDLLGTPIPPAVLARAAAAPVDPLQRLRYAPREQPVSRLADGLQKVAGAGNLRRGLRLAWGLLFPDPAYMRATYGVRGPLRLALSYGARWIEVVRGGVLAR